MHQTVNLHQTKWSDYSQVSVITCLYLGACTATLTFVAAFKVFMMCVLCNKVHNKTPHHTLILMCS